MEPLPPNQQPATSTPIPTPLPPTPKKERSYDLKFTILLIILLLIWGLILLPYVRKPAPPPPDPSANLQLKINKELNDPAISNLKLVYSLSGKVSEIKPGPEPKTLVWSIQLSSGKVIDVKVGTVSQDVFFPTSTQASASASLGVANGQITQVQKGTSVRMQIEDQPTQNALPTASLIQVLQ